MPAPGANETLSEVALPYKLKRPQFVRGLSLVLIPVLAVLALMKNEAVFSLVALFGGSLWLVMGLILLANWQVVTLYEDHLLVVNFGRPQTALYAEMRMVETTPGARGTDGPTALPTLHVHRGWKEKTIEINLANLAVKDRRILVQVIKERAPKVQLDALSKLLAKGEWNGS
jgi:hypothetical protein